MKGNKKKNITQYFHQEYIFLPLCNVMNDGMLAEYVSVWGRYHIKLLLNNMKVITEYIFLYT